MAKEDKLIKIINEKDRELNHLRTVVSSQRNKNEELAKSFQEMKEKYVQCFESRLGFKVKKKLETFFSVLAVLLTPGQNETTLVKRLGMFFKTMLSWAKNGFKLEEEQTALARFKICQSCPELKKPQNQCTICGCMMEKKTKLSGASCPLKKW